MTFPDLCTGFSCTSFTSCSVANAVFHQQFDPNVIAAPTGQGASTWTLSITANTNAVPGPRFLTCFANIQGYQIPFSANLEIVPTVTISCYIGVPVGGTTDYDVEISSGSSAEPIQLTVTTSSGTEGLATFSDGTTSTTITQSQSVTVVGVTVSSVADNIILLAQPLRVPGVALAQQNLSVVTVAISMRASADQVPSPDNAAAALYESNIGPALGPLITTYGIGTIPTCAIGVEFVGQVTPSGYRGPIVMRRYDDGGTSYKNSVVYGQVGSMDDTSFPQFRDDDPQSGRSGGNVYDLDAPGIPPDTTSFSVYRVRNNFHEYAVLGSASSTKQVSNTLFHWARSSRGVDNNYNSVFNYDVSGDNQAGIGTTNTNWNLQP